MSTYTSNYAWEKPEGGDPVDISVLNDNLDDQDAVIHNAYMQLASVFSATSTYEVDDVVLYANNLYKCHTAIITAGAWTGSTNWTQVKVSDICGGGGGTSSQKTYGNPVSILTHNSAQNPYIIPSDGIIQIGCNYSDTSYMILYKVTPLETLHWANVRGHSGMLGGRGIVPVLKDEQFYIASQGTDPVALFYPYEDAT